MPAASAPLPRVDEHRIGVRAPPARAWEAIARLARRLRRSAPAAFVALWRLEPASGFEVAEEDPPRRLVLRGRHRFARYELAFAVESGGDGGAVVSARTLAAFPGMAGALYRAAVIGSGGHRIAVRRMLARIAREAEGR